MKHTARKNFILTISKHHLQCLLMVCASLFLFSEAVSAGTARAIGQVSVFGNGTYPESAIVSQTVSGLPVVVNQADGSYVTNGATLKGNPGIVTTNISIDTYAMKTENLVTASITADLSTGMVTIAASGPGLGAKPAAITVDGKTVTVPNQRGFKATLPATVKDQIIQACINAGEKVCVKIFLRNAEQQPVYQ